MLSKKMALALRDNYQRSHPEFRDGRTVRALHTRGFIKYVRYSANARTWKWKYTLHGRSVARQLSWVSDYVFPLIFR